MPRLKLSPTEPTVRYYIHLKESTKRKLDRMGKPRVRKVLDQVEEKRND